MCNWPVYNLDRCYIINNYLKQLLNHSWSEEILIYLYSKPWKLGFYIKGKITELLAKHESVRIFCFLMEYFVKVFLSCAFSAQFGDMQ